MFIELPNFISDKEVHWLRNTMQQHKHLYKSDIDGSKYGNFRMGHTIEITTNPELKEVDNFLLNTFNRAYYQVIERKFRPPYLSADSGYEYHLYPAGTVCKTHIDGEIGYTFGSGNRHIRYATLVLHLTDNDDALLVFPDHEKEIKTEAGKLVIFPPHGCYQHYTTPSKTDREIIMTWFYYSELKVEDIK